MQLVHLRRNVLFSYTSFIVGTFQPFHYRTMRQEVGAEIVHSWSSSFLAIYSSILLTFAELICKEWNQYTGLHGRGKLSIVGQANWYINQLCVCDIPQFRQLIISNFNKNNIDLAQDYNIYQRQLNIHQYMIATKFVSKTSKMPNSLLICRCKLIKYL